MVLASTIRLSHIPIHVFPLNKCTHFHPFINSLFKLLCPRPKVSRDHIISTSRKMFFTQFRRLSFIRRQDTVSGLHPFIKTIVCVILFSVIVFFAMFASLRSPQKLCSSSDDEINGCFLSLPKNSKVTIY